MFTFSEYQKLDEKQILFGQGKRHGQVVFVAGGAGSGKGFAITNFMQKERFKIRDVDEWKSALIRLDKIANDVNKRTKQKGIDTKKKFGVSAGKFKLSKSEDVFALHNMVQDLGWKEKTLDYLLFGAKNPQTLPNIMFDVTLKSTDAFAVIPRLLSLGYDAKNIHIVWVLTDYKIAAERNASRERVVPKDIFLKTHVGAAKNMIDIIKGRIPKGVDGRIDIILNNKENTVFYTDSKGRPLLTGKDKTPVIKTFASLNIKKAGKKPISTNDVHVQLYNWIKDNVPKDALDNTDLELR